MRISDWSSDVCSSDLVGNAGVELAVLAAGVDTRRQVIEQRRVEVVAGEGCVQLLRVHAAQPGAQAFADHLARKLRGVGAEQGCHDVPAHARALRLAPGADVFQPQVAEGGGRSEAHTSELQSLMRISSAVFCLKKKHKTV